MNGSIVATSPCSVTVTRSAAPWLRSSSSTSAASGVKWAGTYITPPLVTSLAALTQPEVVPVGQVSRDSPANAVCGFCGCGTHTGDPSDGTGTLVTGRLRRLTSRVQSAAGL